MNTVLSEDLCPGYAHKTECRGGLQAEPAGVKVISEVRVHFEHVVKK